VAGGHVHALYRHGASTLHRLAPQVKIAAAFGVVLAIVMTPREAIWAFVGYAVALSVLAGVAGLAPGFIARRMVVEVPFVIVALLLPLFGGGEQVEVLGISLSVQGLWDMWNILAKATLGLFVAVILGATTQIPDMIKGLDALRVPAVVTGIITFMVRYVDVIVGDFSRMRVAMASRGHQTRTIADWGPYARTVGVMFVRTYERGERVYLAMASRGYDGSMPDSLRIPAPARQWLAAGLFVAGFWLVTALGWATR
jgi:cobalt/nickel transport system permease protein